MAGQPEFTRAKRLKFFNTSAQILGDGSIELAPTTSLILHPTTNLVASPEGNYTVRTKVKIASTVHGQGTASIDGGVYTRGGGNVITRRKTKITYSDFTAASTDQIAKVLDIVAGDTVADIFGVLATPFKYDVGPATVIGSICKIKLGDMSDRDGFGVRELVGSSIAANSYLFEYQTGMRKGAYLYSNASTLRKNKFYSSAASIELQLTASSFFVASLTQGALTVYTDYIQLSR